MDLRKRMKQRAKGINDLSILGLTIGEYQDGFVVEAADDASITRLRSVAGPFATYDEAQRWLTKNFGESA